MAITKKECDAVLRRFSFSFKDEPGLEILTRTLSPDTLVELIKAKAAELPKPGSVRELVRLCVIHRVKVAHLDTLDDKNLPGEQHLV